MAATIFEIRGAINELATFGASVAKKLAQAEALVIQAETDAAQLSTRYTSIIGDLKQRAGEGDDAALAAMSAESDLLAQGVTEVKAKAAAIKAAIQSAKR